MAPQFNGGIGSGPPTAMSAAAMQLEVLFGASPQRPADKPAPTDIVRRKRLIPVGEGAGPVRGIAAPQASGLASERPARVFVRSKTEA
jgi:hypothetical protein